jgi:hypothetical protein
MASKQKGRVAPFGRSPVLVDPMPARRGQGDRARFHRGLSRHLRGKIEVIRVVSCERTPRQGVPRRQRDDGSFFRRCAE